MSALSALLGPPDPSDVAAAQMQRAGGRPDPATGCPLAVLGDVAGVFGQPSPQVHGGGSRAPPRAIEVTTHLTPVQVRSPRSAPEAVQWGERATSSLQITPSGPRKGVHAYGRRSDFSPRGVDRATSLPHAARRPATRARTLPSFPNRPRRGAYIASDRPATPRLAAASDGKEAPTR
jgi:hypothetical protein